MVTEILHDAIRFKRQIADLKLKSPKYPKIHVEYTDFVVWYSTLVEWEREGIKYSRHHVESCHKPPNCSEETWENIKIKTLGRLNDMAATCIEKAIPCEYDDRVEK